MESITDVETIDRWAEERLLDDGEWVTDTMFCILCVMENRAPYRWEGESRNEAEYKALIKIACRYLRETKDIKGAFELGERLADDGRDLTYEERSALRALVERELSS